MLVRSRIASLSKRKAIIAIGFVVLLFALNLTTFTANTDATNISLVSEKVSGDPLNPQDPLWASVDSTMIPTTGNPATGGHGGVGSDLPELTAKSVYTSSDVYLYYEWEDAESDAIHSYWQFNGTSWTKISTEEDRLYMAFAINDVAGREGKTFSQAGCAMLCHQMDSGKNIILSQKNMVDCGECHADSQEVASTFSHQEIGEGALCFNCHQSTKEVSYESDMISPVGGSYDIWHWKNGRSSNIGIADDQFTGGGKPRGNDGSPGTDYDNQNYLKTSPAFIWPLNGSNTYSTGSYDNMLKKSDLTMMVPLTSDGLKTLIDGKNVPVGTTVRAKVMNDVNAASSNTNIKSLKVFEDGKHKIVMKRALNTNDPKDYQFDRDGINMFSVAVTDASSIMHTGNTMVDLTFEDPQSIVEDNDPAITYSPACWTEQLNVNLSNGSAQAAKKKGCSAQLTFDGSSIAVSSVKGPVLGKVDILLDGQKMTTVDLYSKNYMFDQEIYKFESAMIGEHTISMVATGTKNTKSSNTYIALDNFEINK